MEQDLLVQRLYVSEVPFRDLFDGDTYLCVEISRGVHYAVRTFTKYHSAVVVV